MLFCWDIYEDKLMELSGGTCSGHKDKPLEVSWIWAQDMQTNRWRSVGYEDRLLEVSGIWAQDMKTHRWRSVGYGHRT